MLEPEDQQSKSTDNMPVIIAEISDLPNFLQDAIQSGVGSFGEVRHGAKQLRHFLGLIPIVLVKGIETSLTLINIVLYE